MPPLASPAPQMEAFKSRDLSVQLPPSADCHSSQQERDNPPPPTSTHCKDGLRERGSTVPQQLEETSSRSEDVRSTRSSQAKSSNTGDTEGAFQPRSLSQKSLKDKAQAPPAASFQIISATFNRNQSAERFRFPRRKGGGNLSSRWQSRWLWLEPPGHEGSF